MSAPVIIVGAGQGGLQVAESLRSHGYQGEILLCGEEPWPPYQRPPLSKGLLLGEMTREQLTIRKPEVLDKKQINLRLNCRVIGVDPASRSITLEGGEILGYSDLVLATGARPRDLPLAGADRKGVFSLRTLNDTLAIQASLGSAENVVVVGGGFIGLEMAAVARKLNKTVTVVEFADRLMARVVSPPISEWYQQLHEQHGCNVMLNTALSELHLDESGQVTAVSLSNGERLVADMVVLGIGVLPNTELAEQAGIACSQGIITDQCGRTSEAHIYAIGDCAAQQREGQGLLRLESVQNAVEMAKAAAAAICDQNKPFVAAPWFWSDQYDVKLQMVGLASGYDEAVLRGQLDDGKFSWFYFKNGRLLAVDSINQPLDHMIGRKLLSGENSLLPGQAANPDYELKSAL